MLRTVLLTMIAVLSPLACMSGELNHDGKADCSTGYLNFSRLKPEEMKERVMCSVIAAVKYDVPANVILAVAEIEAGKPGRYVGNSNGTFDVGSMQFNTAYLKDLAKYGITAEDVAIAGCYPYELAAWRLRGHILNDTGDLWTRAANYHSKTAQFNSIYREKLIRASRKWAEWLSLRFKTHDVLKN